MPFAVSLRALLPRARLRRALLSVSAEDPLLFFPCQTKGARVLMGSLRKELTLGAL